MTKMPDSRDRRSPAPERLSLLDRFRRLGMVRRFFRLSLVDQIMSPARGDRSVHKFIRYSMVSGVAIVISQVTILICAAIFGLSGIAANTIGGLMATPASYELNRKWAWGKSGKSHLWREVVPFWALTLVGFLASTGTVQIADTMCQQHHVTGVPRALAIMGASLFAYGVVWIAKFVIFNRLVFAGGRRGRAWARPTATSPARWRATACWPRPPPRRAPPDGPRRPCARRRLWGHRQ